MAKRMVYALRVEELQGFLQSCNLNTDGKRDQLRQRALVCINSAIKSASLHFVLAKLRLYYQRHFSQAATAVPGHGVGGVQKQSLWSSGSAVDVQFKVLPFHKNLANLLKPILLPSFDDEEATAPRTLTFECSLTPEQVDCVEVGRSTVPSVYGPDHKSDIHFTVEVLVRFAECNLSSMQDDQYPPKCHLYVNGETVIMPGYEMAKSSGKLKKHGQPVEITANMLLSGMNIIEVVCLPVPAIGKYVVAVDLCLKRSSADLLQQVCHRIRSADMCRAHIKDKLTSGGGKVEVLDNSLRSSLKCPLGTTRIVYPGRSINCKHVNCFDMASFLQMNEKNGSWVCPICDCSAVYDSLMIDGLMKEVLDKCPSSVDHIEYKADGTWMPYNPRDANQRRATGGPASCATNAVGSAAMSTVSDNVVPAVIDLTDSLEACEQKAGDDGPTATAGLEVSDQSLGLTLVMNSDDDSSASTNYNRMKGTP
ncbi:E3 SUMO-protein ligase PIAS3-like [Sycon ciliatum]|uniref:E3 SUMO-protein ligase PIAS3-like n=1 Tax=Sycon ciliatum TaxID=27933 RepID=UPI0031F7102B